MFQRPVRYLFSGGIRYRIKVGQYIFKVVYSRKYSSQRLFRQYQLRVCGAKTTSQLLVEPNIQYQLPGLSLSSTVLFLEVFDVNRIRSPIHNLHKADLQPETDRSPNHVALMRP